MWFNYVIASRRPQCLFHTLCFPDTSYALRIVTCEPPIPSIQIIIIIIIINIIQVKETLSQAAEFGVMPEDSEYPFPELIVLMGWLNRSQSVFNHFPRIPFHPVGWDRRSKVLGRTRRSPRSFARVFPRVFTRVYLRAFARVLSRAYPLTQVFSREPAHVRDEPGGRWTQPWVQPQRVQWKWSYQQWQNDWGKMFAFLN